MSRLSFVRRMLPALALALAGASLAGCGEQPHAASEHRQDRPVLVTPVKYEPRVEQRTFVATVQARVESDLGFRVAGKLSRRLVNVGDRVAAGTVLATLDETDLRLQQQQAEAERAAAAGNLVQAEAELQRAVTLNRNGWTATAVLDRSRAAAEEARGRLLRAERAVSLANNAAAYAHLVADADGVVTAALAEAGQVVAVGQPAIRLARLAEKEAVAAIPEALVGTVRNGTATMVLWSDRSRTYAASLRELSPSADPATRTFLARFTILNADERVGLGMTATLSVEEAAGDKIARLPLSALYNAGAGAAVWVVSPEGDLTLKPVHVAAYEGREVLIASGLEDGEKAVALGVQKLDAGQKVRVVQNLSF